jgi:hypothetical protein
MAKNRQNSPKDQMPTIKYLVNEVGRNGGSFVIELPADWRVTFSNVNPAQGMGGGRDGYCLRVYEGEKLRAVYGNVIGFRDLSIPLARKVQTEVGNASWTRDDAGNLDEHRQIEASVAWDRDDALEAF